MKQIDKVVVFSSISHGFSLLLGKHNNYLEDVEGFLTAYKTPTANKINYTSYHILQTL